MPAHRRFPFHGPRSIRQRAGQSRAWIAILALVVAPALAAGPPYAGRPLHDVLEEFNQAGLHLVFSSETVPDSLTVTQEPRPGAPLEVLREMLAQHGLRAKTVGSNTYAIVKQKARAVARSPASAPAPLEEVVVAASRYSLSAEVSDAHTFLTQAEMVSMPRLVDDSLKAVHRLPGAATNGVSGLAYMRGGEDIETLVVLDGFPLYEPFHLKVLLSPTSLLDPSVVSGLDVHAGGYTAEFGDRMSAVVDARSVHPGREQYQLGLSLYNASLFAANQFADGKGEWVLAARGSNLDLIADLEDASYSELRYADVFGRFDYAFTPATRGSLHVLASSDRAEVTNEPETESADVRYRNGYAWLTLEHDFSDALNASATASYTYVRTNRQGEVDEEGVRYGEADDHRHYDVFGLRLDGGYRAERWYTRFGGEVRWMDASYDYHSIVHFEPDYPFPGNPGLTRVNELSPEPTGQHYALYATTRVRIAEPLTAELGLRWDDETYTPEGDDQWGPRVNVLYQAAPKTRLRASWGIYQQSQGIHELQVEDGVDRYFRPQRATHEIVGVEQGLPYDFTLRLEGYIKAYDRPRLRFESLYDPTSLVPELRWDRVAIWPRSSRAKGIELLVTRKSASAWNGWFNYAWSKVDDRRDGTSTLRSWDQTSNVGGGITWSQGDWQATLAATYHTGWPTTPVRLVGSAPGSQTIVVGPRNASRLAHYASLDARVSRDFTLGRSTLTVFAEASNLADRANPCCTDFDYEIADDGSVELEKSYRNWLPLVPNIGVQWKF